MVASNTQIPVGQWPKAEQVTAVWRQGEAGPWSWGHDQDRALTGGAYLALRNLMSLNPRFDDMS